MMWLARKLLLLVVFFVSFSLSVSVLQASGLQLQHLRDHLYLGNDNYVYGRYRRPYTHVDSYGYYHTRYKWYYRKLFPYAVQTLEDYCQQHNLGPSNYRGNSRYNYSQLTPGSTDWRQALIDLSMQERRSALEHNEFLEAVQALGLQDRIPYAQGYGGGGGGSAAATGYGPYNYTSGGAGGGAGAGGGYYYPNGGGATGGGATGGGATGSGGGGYYYGGGGNVAGGATGTGSATGGGLAGGGLTGFGGPGGNVLGSVLGLSSGMLPGSGGINPLTGLPNGTTPFEFSAQAYFAQQGATPYTLRYSTLADIYGKTNTEILYNQAQNLVQGAQQAARDAVSGHQATLQMEVDGRNRVAEIIAQGQSAAESIRATAEALKAAQPPSSVQMRASGAIAAATETAVVTEGGLPQPQYPGQPPPQPQPPQGDLPQPQYPGHPQQPQGDLPQDDLPQPEYPGQPQANLASFPALQQHCAKCHGQTSPEKGFRVDGTPLSPEQFEKAASRVLARTMPPEDKPELKLDSRQLGLVLQELTRAADAFTGPAQ